MESRSIADCGLEAPGPWDLLRSRLGYLDFHSNGDNSVKIVGMENFYWRTRPAEWIGEGMGKRGVMDFTCGVSSWLEMDTS